ncbi:D-2-hydroxyacid dehydrogenase [Acutalibacter caecimuris]|uniref:D-2-hydroxyacid dehydrogenase n=1 Tax=Acutalibacter caecimuris TaxID=3093657 RepID=UPI002AC8C4C0|nr:D-2-hydroxyacid dehydrogenase [Acutalibacter sp. M00118]
MRNPHILVTIPMSDEQREALAGAAPEAKLRFRLGEALPSGRGGALPFPQLLPAEIATEEDIAWADAILGNVQPALLQKAGRLQWLQTSSAGVEWYTAPGVLPEGTVLTNATGAYGLAISEHMLGTLLMVFKKLELYRDAQRREEWGSQGQVRTLLGATVLVLGMGDIGGDFARLCKAMGAYVIGLRRTEGEKPAGFDEQHLTPALDGLLPRADVVAVTLPGTPATRGMLDRARISRMKQGAVVLNVGRGYIIDTEALCDGLESGHLGGAGLDVTEPEPLSPGHRLWQLPTAVVTPHVSGGYHLWETHQRIADIFARNLRRFVAGEPLENQVDFTTGYRKR